MSDDLHLDFTFAAPIQSVYLALTTRKGITCWWTTDAEVGVAAGDACTLRFPGVGIEFGMLIVEHAPFDRVHWRCVASVHGGDSALGEDGWRGTELLFNLRPEDGMETRLSLTHLGMTPERESYGMTQEGWLHYLGDSLRGYLEDGEGEPYGCGD